MPEDLVVHRLRAAQASSRARTRALWTVTCQGAHRQITQLVRDAGIAGPQAMPRGLRHSA